LDIEIVETLTAEFAQWRSTRRRICSPTSVRQNAPMVAGSGELVNGDSGRLSVSRATFDFALAPAAG